MTVLAALAARAIEVRATSEEARAVLASHVRRTIEVLLAAERAHPTATIAARAADAAKAVHIGPTSAADAAGASGWIETTATAVRIVVIVATARYAERARDNDAQLDPNTSKGAASHDGNLSHCRARTATILRSKKDSTDQKSRPPPPCG